ncbi:MAG: hypothetical protein M3401_14840 [Actinomycetota bacterium]|nr:hypothetical protein [Actinomycetota bacterium]
MALAGFAAGLASSCGREAARDSDWTLRWPAPRLVKPTVVRVGAGGGTVRLAADRDYRIVLRMPLTERGGLQIIGGRNVVLVGGHITIPPAGAGATVADRRGLGLSGQTGTVHIEGLLIDNAGGDLSEGIQVAAPRAVVQIQNTRVAGVHARDEKRFTDNHPDVIQTPGGVGELRVHRFTGTTTYQGLFLRGDRAPVGRVALSKVNVVGLPSARYLLWKRCARPYPAPCNGPDFPLEVSDVWARPGPNRPLRLSLKPEPPADDWEAVKEGVPPGGDFVTAADLHARYAPSGGGGARSAP